MMRAIALLSVLASGSISLAADLPRYSLPVGRNLTYANKSYEDEGTQLLSQRTELQATVVSENSDGSKRVILRTTQTVDQGHGISTQRVQVNRIDVFPDGRLAPQRGGLPGSDRTLLFPKLPADAAQVASQWQFVSSIDGSTLNFKPKTDSPQQFVFVSSEDGPMSRIYVTTQKHTTQFDRIKCVVVQDDLEMSQDYGFHSKGTGSMKLQKDEMLEPAKVEALGAEYDVWFTAQQEYMGLMQRMSEEPTQAKKLSDDARAVLERASKNATSDEIKQQFSRALKEHEQSVEFSLEEAQHQLEMLDKPAKDWQARDLDGKDWAMAQLRGKVVVMDFWYRGCGWCMYSMPAVKQLAIEYKDKPVVFLGMNTDRVDKDAQFVVKEFGLPYPQIKASAIAEGMKVQAFPTMIFIDQHGVVRSIDVGYSPDIRAKVKGKLDKMLNMQP